MLQAFVADPERVGWRAYSAVYKGSSQRAAETAWSRLLKRAEFRARHDELLGAVTAAVVLEAAMELQEVLVELSRLGRANMQDYVGVGGDDAGEVIANLRDLPREHAAAIQELTIETYLEGAGDGAREVKRVKLKLHDKRGALAELRRHHEPQKHEHTGKNGKAIEVKDVKPLSDLDLARRIAFLLSKGAAQAGATAPAPAAPKPAS